MGFLVKTLKVPTDAGVEAVHGFLGVGCKLDLGQWEVLMNSPIAVDDLHPNPGTEGPVELPPLRSTDLSLGHDVGHDDVGHDDVGDGDVRDVMVLIGFELSSQLKNNQLWLAFIPKFLLAACAPDHVRPPSPFRHDFPPCSGTARHVTHGTNITDWLIDKLGKS